MSKEYVNFPVKLDTELHQAIKESAFMSNMSIQQLLSNILREKFIIPGKVLVYKTSAVGKSEVKL